jgi:murein DD-endopeptidase MepM/ murein hydrolase activator NlpD
MLTSLTRSERIIIVDDDHIRSVTIGPKQRLRPALLVSLAFLGMIGATIGWIGCFMSLRSAHADNRQIEAGVDRLAGQLDESRARLAETGMLLERSQDALDAAIANERALQVRLESALSILAKAENADARALRQMASAARQELLPLRIGALEGGSPLSIAERSLHEVESLSGDFAIRRAQAASASLLLVSDGLDFSPDEVSPMPVALASTGFARLIAESRAEAVHYQSEAKRLEEERDSLAITLQAQEQRAQETLAGQLSLIAHLSEQADGQIGALLSELTETGLNIDKLLGQVERIIPGMGGPLVALPDQATVSLSPESQAALRDLEEKLVRQAKLKALGRYLPLTPPVDNFYVSSGFGRRLDPFTQQWALHSGLDLVAREGTPVTAPAAGIVIAVDTDPGYGHVVDIDHGFGVVTRYGHLKKASVRQGEKVNFGSTIGTIGNTGRSSGPHLHYEVLLEGKAVDPLRFMEKGRHVCQG